MRKGNPYVGPRAFTKGDAALFFGRDHEAADLVALTIANSLVVLHAQSGVGKSSLVAARLIPDLEQEKCYSLGIGRLQLADNVASSKDGNTFVRALASSLEWSEPAAEESAGKLTDYIERAIDLVRSAHTTREVTRTSDSSRFVLVIDQFEELYTARPDLWAYRQPFLQQISRALRSLPRLTVVLCVREEFLAYTMNIGRLMAGLNIAWFRLERLDRDAALAAIEGPLKGTGVSLARDALEKLAHFLFTIPADDSAADDALQSEYAEPMHLQVVCESLWESLPADENVINARMVEVSGRVEDALENYYERSIRIVVREHAASEASTRGWIERHLITSARTRALVRKEVGATRQMSNEIIEALARRYLLREERRGRDTWYELSHDRLVLPVLQSNLSWREQTGVHAQWEHLENVAAEWTSAQPLLAGRALKEAQMLIARHDVREYGVSPALDEFVTRSAEYATEQRAYVRRRLGIYAATFVGLLILIGAWWLAQYSMRRTDATVKAYTDVAQELSKDPEKTYMALSYSIRAYDSAFTKEQKKLPRKLLGELVESAGNDVRLGTVTESRFVKIAPDGRAVAGYGTTGLTIWALPSTKILLRVNGYVTSAQFSQDGKRVAVTAPASRSERAIVVFDLSTRAVVARWQGVCTPFRSRREAECAALSADLRHAAILEDERVRVLSLADGREEMQFVVGDRIDELAWAQAGPALYAFSAQVDSPRAKESEIHTDVIYALPLNRQCVRWSNHKHDSDPCQVIAPARTFGVRALLAKDGTSLLIAEPSWKRRETHTTVHWYSIKRGEVDGLTEFETRSPVFMAIDDDGQNAAVMSRQTGRVWLHTLGSSKWSDGARGPKSSYEHPALPGRPDAIVGFRCRDEKDEAPASEDFFDLSCFDSAQVFSWDFQRGSVLLTWFKDPGSIKAIPADLRSVIRDDGVFLILHDIGSSSDTAPAARGVSEGEELARACAAIAYRPEAFSLENGPRKSCADVVRTGGFANADFAALRSPIELGMSFASPARLGVNTGI